MEILNPETLHVLQVDSASLTFQTVAGIPAQNSQYELSLASLLNT